MSGRAWLALASISTLWGIPYLFIKIAVDDGVPPAFLAWARIALAAVLLLGLTLRGRLLGTLRGRWGWVALYAVLELVGPFPLIAAGERDVSSSLTAILIAAVPLMVALLAIRFDEAERAGGRRLVGLLVGFAGVVALVGIDVAGRGDELLGAGAILLAAAGYASGGLLLKRKLADVDPRATMAGALAVATLALAPLAFAAPPGKTPSGEALVSIVVLGVFCTAAALVLFGWLVAEIGPARTSVLTYIAPIVAVALGVAVLDERLGPGAVVGMLLILAGSWLSTDGRLPPGPSGIAALVRKRARARHLHLG